MKATSRTFWRSGYRPKVEPKVVRLALEKIRAQRGALAAPYVVEAARSPRSPLHPLFEWSDTKAAHLYRLTVARCIIHHIDIEYRDDQGNTLKAPAFVSVVNRNDPILNVRDVYVALTEVSKDARLTDEVLTNARRELETWKARYEKYAVVLNALRPVFRAIEKINGKDGLHTSP